MLRWGIAAATLAVVFSALPSTALARESCLYQDDAAKPSNRANVQRSLLCLTNVHRIRSGSPALLSDTRLLAAASAHSTDMVTRNYLSHTNPEGQDQSARAMAAGYPGGAGENIAANNTGTAFSLFEQWRNSTQGHNENMLNPAYKAAGFGIDPHFLGGPSGITGTQMFGFIPADTDDDALDLYASSNKCAKEKLTLIFAKGKLKKGKGNRQRLKLTVKAMKKLIKKDCKVLEAPA
jgi:uncharacterized protein YkwD